MKLNSVLQGVLNQVVMAIKKMSLMKKIVQKITIKIIANMEPQSYQVFMEKKLVQILYAL